MIITHGSNASATGRPVDPIRVVSWNIQFGIQVEAAALTLAEDPDLTGADILLVQEMDETGMELLADALELNYVYAAPGPHEQSGRNFGNGVLTPWPIGEPEVVPLPHKSSIKGQERVLVRTTVSLADRQVDVGSVHTEVPSLGAAKRLAQFEEIARAFERRPEQPAIVGGDFNTMTRRGIKLITDRMRDAGAARVSAGSGTTLRRGGQEFTLDHVFARGFERVTSGVVAGATASDHRPVWVELRARPVGRP